MRRLLILLALLAAPAASAAPERVVSINLCTDQLAMLVAAPGQLVSVSALAADPLYSPMVERAKSHRINHGLAEEIFLMRPDLVLAGQHVATGAVDMLRRLGIRVEVFPVAEGLGDVGQGLARMGRLLGREARAARIAADFAADLAAIRTHRGPALRAATWYPNGYTSGAGSLADAILAAAGMRNIAAERGISGLARLPLEELVMAAPDLVIAGQAPDTPALAEGVQTHPALAAVTAGTERTAVAGNAWICGTPHVLSAIRNLAETGRRLAPDVARR